MAPLRPVLDGSGRPPLLLGDEAVALAALHAGISAAYAYPGTPSTEIFEYLEPRAAEFGVTAHWCANEKTAYEQALGTTTVARLREILAAARLDGIVAPRNPLDVTPILGDAGFVAAAEALVHDPGVDVAVLGCVPLTPALRTLASCDGGADDLEAEDGVAAGLARLWERTSKAWVVTVDGGGRYHALAGALQDAGIPVLRQADRAVELLGRYVAVRLRHPGKR